MPYKNPEKRKAVKRAWHAKNPDYGEKWRAKNPDYARNRYWANRDNILAEGKRGHIEDPRKGMLNGARGRAKKKNLAFTLVIEDVVVPDVCPVLGLWLGPTQGRPTDHSPTIDRIIPEKGYVKGNVRVISYRANSLKKDATAGEMILLGLDALTWE